MIEATLPRARAPTASAATSRPAEAGEHGQRAGARRLVLTHISDELDARRARAEAERDVRRRRSSSRARAPSTRSDGRMPGPMPGRDLFANFERMRREMDELFGDVFDRTGLAPRARRLLARGRRLLRAATRRARSSRPSWPASTSTSSTLEIQGRELVLAGQRARRRSRGPRLPAARDRARAVPPRHRSSAPTSRRARPRPPTRTACCAIELPLVAAGRRRAQRCRSRSRDDRSRASPDDRGRQRRRRARRRGRRRSAACRRRCRCCRCARRSPFPDTLTPLAVGQERSIELVNDVLRRRPHARDGRQPQPRARGARARRPLRRRRASASSRAC